MKADVTLPPEIAAEFEAMSGAERSFLLRALQSADTNRAALRELEDCDYERRPVSIREFLSDPLLLGNTGRIQSWENDDDDSAGIYRFWRHELDDLFDPDKKYQQWIVSAAIGSGKSFVS